MPAPVYDTNTTASELVNDYKSIIQDKTILITGASPGSLGGYYAQNIAKANPACIILAGRNTTKLEQCTKEIQAASPKVKIRTLKLDLSSLQSTREAAAEVVDNWDDIPAIDVLVNNAGIMAPEYRVSVDGFESQFATNHLGPFLFTNLIMKKILKSTSPRIVTVASDGHRLSPLRFDDYNFDGGNTYDKWVAYGQSKTANMLMALSLANKLGIKHGLLAFSLHPGVILTNLGSHLDWDDVDVKGLWSTDRRLGNAEGWKTSFDFKTPERGVATHVYASFDPLLKANNGAYLIDSHIADPLQDTLKPWTTSEFEAERLWRLSEKLVGEEFPY
ncbi:hypothetical protein N7509_007672 [Penicillium cosmopolitanum]|uniref:Short-chain dehydrogenase n=1 Tax=Penicillium cosmopolitanum TaxID=1131564 RepID=A0A9X0B8M0_9EURO|nr:uncharacterized protein N7509_007672 [Penicillium cosmopolitanum]KAJ5392182.1 hypothetical protein N7509_007672 [Penicillium cosmopolitanum]